MKRRIRGIIIFTGVILILCLGIVLLSGLGGPKLQHRFFSDITEFDKLNSYAVKDLEKTGDKDLGRLAPEESYTKEIVYDGETYQVYAYCFSDPEDAKAYFHNNTGKKTKNNQDFCMSSNRLFSSEYVAFQGGCLYKIQGGSYRKFVNAVNFFTESFSVEPDS